MISLKTKVRSPSSNLPQMASSPAKTTAFGWGGVVTMLETAKEFVLPGPESPIDEEPHTRDLARGEVALFERLFHKHGKRMKSIAANLLGSSADAEDAVQETFLKVHRSASGFRGAAQPSTWIYRILLNTCYDQLRRTSRRAEDPLPPRLEHTPASAADHPLRLALEAEVARLPEQERSAFLLCEVEGFSHREAGEILEVPEATSRTFLFRAKRRLQHALRGSTAPGEAPAEAS